MAIAYLDEQEDAEETRQVIEGYGQQCLLLPGDLRDETLGEVFICQSLSDTFLNEIREKAVIGKQLPTMLNLK